MSNARWMLARTGALFLAAGLGGPSCLPQEGVMSGTGGTGSDWSKLPPVVAPDLELAQLGSSRQAQYDKLCANKKGDSFFKLVCDNGRPHIPDLAALLKLVGLDQNRAFALTGNSTSLVAMSVSALNPRVIIFPRVGENLERSKEMIAIGYVRGEQFVEVASRDNQTGEPNFYLLSFEQDCSYRGGCDLANLLTEEIEHNWTAFSIYDQQDLEKTSFDCLTCHQPAGYGTKKILRMQELNSPWMHWFPQRFVQRTDSDRVLLAQFLQTHAKDGQYGALPMNTLANTLDEGSGAQLEAFVRSEGFADQPNPFDAAIATEAAGGQPSPTWQARFDAAVRGDAIPVPYPRVDVTDEGKRSAAMKSYQDVTAGSAPRSTLVDIRDVFSQDAQEKLAFVPASGASGRAILVEMCSRCHDGRANPVAGRSRFNIKTLDQMNRAQKDLAIQRMQEPRETRMPPWRVGSLPPAALQAAIDELKK